MLEHPSVYDAMTYYSQIHGCELRVAGVNKQSGGVDADAVIREIVNYVSGLGAKIALAGSDRRRLFETGMSRTASHDRALLGLALEGSGLAKGLRAPMDGAPLCQRDFIIGIEFERLSCEQAVREYEKRGVITFERSAESPYSKRMVEAFDSKGMVRVSPLHVHSPEEIERFLLVTEEIAGM